MFCYMFCFHKFSVKCFVVFLKLSVFFMLICFFFN